MRRMPCARGTKARYRKEAFVELEQRAKQRREERAARLEVKSGYIGSKIFEAEYVSKAFDVPGADGQNSRRLFLTTFTTTLHVSKRWALWVAMVPARAHSSNYCLDLSNPMKAVLLWVRLYDLATSHKTAWTLTSKTRLLTRYANMLNTLTWEMADT